MTMKLSVSVACLPPARRSEMVETLAGGLVEDLHCDLFGVEPGAGIAESELLDLLDAWPRSLSIHQWASSVPTVVSDLAPAPRRRLIVELVGQPDVDTLAVSRAVGGGWQVLVGCRPHLADAAIHLIDKYDCPGVQLLTTSTPGWAGGSFVETAWSIVPRLRSALGAKVVELDGGITTALARRARLLGCEMVVLGSNAIGLKDGMPLIPGDLATSR